MSDKKYQFILLDWDGCVADTLSVWMAAYKKIFAEFGLFPTEREIGKKAFGNWEAAKAFGIQDRETFLKNLLDFAQRELLKVQLNPGAKLALEELKAGGKNLAVLSSSRRSDVEPAIKRLGLSPVVDFLLAKEDVTKLKPDPEIINKALSLFGVSPDTAVKVGDSEKDILAGKAAGVATVLYFPPSNEIYYDEAELLSYQPDYSIHNFSELVKIVWKKSKIKSIWITVKFLT